MKKVTALLLCFLLLCTCSVNAFATETDEKKTSSVISTTVPESHKITVSSDDARVFFEDVSGDELTVDRLSRPRLLIRADEGKVIKTVLLNGEDVTDLLRDGYLELPLMYEDATITVITEDKPTLPNTSDSTNLHLWWLTLTLSAVSIVALELLRRKRKAR